MPTSIRLQPPAPFQGAADAPTGPRLAVAPNGKPLIGEVVHELGTWETHVVGYSSLPDTRGPSFGHSPAGAFQGLVAGVVRRTRSDSIPSDGPLNIPGVWGHVSRGRTP